MTVQTFKIDPAEVAKSIVVTEAAENHFKQQLGKSGKSAIRLSLKESGCTGFMYVIEEVEQAEAADAQKPLSNGVTLWIDTAHYSAIKGTEIDLVQQGVNKNLMMNNPNVKDACGCGESFSV